MGDGAYGAEVFGESKELRKTTCLPSNLLQPFVFIFALGSFPIAFTHVRILISSIALEPTVADFDEAETRVGILIAGV